MLAIQAGTVAPGGALGRKISVRSGQGASKTLTGGIAAMWRTIRHEGTLGMVTAPTERQTKQWMAELARNIRKAHPLLQKFTRFSAKEMVFCNIPGWGIKCVTATRAENLAGIHQTHLYFIVDEASGMSNELISTIEGTLTNADHLLILTGNPTRVNNALHDSFTRSRHLYRTFVFNCVQIAQERPDIISPARNEYMAEKYGKDSSEYTVRVLGDFPNQDDFALLPLDDLEACTRTSRLACASVVDMLTERRSFGIDLAAFGHDRSVIAQREGLAVLRLESRAKMDPNDALDIAYTWQLDSGWPNPSVRYHVDADGVGIGVVRDIRRKGKQLFEFKASARPMEPEMFDNTITEAWWNFRQFVLARACHIPNDPELLMELSTRNYDILENGKIRIESKPNWKKRNEIKQSPDKADATVMAFYAPLPPYADFDISRLRARPPRRRLKQ